MLTKAKRPDTLNGFKRTNLAFRPINFIVAIPVLLSWRLWTAFLTGAESRGWDGTGHYAIGTLYDQLIFPNTIGWTTVYFGGMPFPNFYPPLFYSLVALLHHTHLFSFSTAFKIVLSIPVLLMPAAIWWLAWRVSENNQLVTAAASLATVVLLVDLRFMGVLLAGLDYFSTFQIGLYTQPLGFVLMSAWLVVYLGSNQTRAQDGGMQAFDWRFALAAILLALTVLSNFFSAITASVFIAAALAIDAFDYWRARRTNDGPDPNANLRRRKFISHLLSPTVAFLLAAFWLIPMLTQYDYFVTRPHAPELESMFSIWLVVWYAIAVFGCVTWCRALRKKLESSASHAARTYLVACAMLLALVVFSAIAPGWFPLQTPRFIATLTFLLTAPVGFALAAGFRLLAKLLGETSTKNQTITLRRMKFSVGIAALIFLGVVLTAPEINWAYTFYPKRNRSTIDDVLSFARMHREGRYLVEVINPKLGPAWTEASGDARAINSYLGSQGNETISGVFHEASPNALFTLPLVNAFSNFPDSFGVSSILADDLDFASQPLSEHVKRAQFLRVKYLLIRTPAMKQRVSKEIPSAIRYDIGWWAAFELRDALPPKVQALQNKPALVLSDFTVKARRRNEMSFIRLAEEQFAGNWFDVLLVRSPERKIDRLNGLQNFGALIIDNYDYEDEDAAFDVLKKFASNRPLICFSSNNAVFRRIQQARDQFSFLEIVDRQPEAAGETVEALKPSYHYDSTEIRKQWTKVRSVIDRMKIPTNVTPTDVVGEIRQESISVSSQVDGPIPVLIANTFHPSWQRTDKLPVYAATPFYTLTFVDKTAKLVYRNHWSDRFGFWLTAVAAALVFFSLGWQGRRLARH